MRSRVGILIMSTDTKKIRASAQNKSICRRSRRRFITVEKGGREGGEEGGRGKCSWVEKVGGEGEEREKGHRAVTLAPLKAKIWIVGVCL